LNELWVGFDEAGLGPILGPLSLSLFTTTKQFDFPILDSKKIHKKGNLSPLYKKICQYCFDFEIKNENSKLRELNSNGHHSEPWFKASDPHESIYHYREHETDLYSRLIAVSEYNFILNSGLNKADTVLLFLKPMMDQVIKKAKAYDRVNLCFDRLGGRKKYRPILENWGITIASGYENNDTSRYFGNHQGQPWEISFKVKGDLTHHCIAAASLFSKCRRELAMQDMNHWWQTRVPNLMPTAGYWTDGLRFLKNIDLYRNDRKISEDVLRRIK